MTEVHRYKVVKMLSEGGNRISYNPHGPEVVMAEAYDQLKAENEDYRSGQDRYEQIIDDLKAESEALRKDAERYRAIRDEIPHADLGRAILDAQTADEYDAAVDAAMAKEANHG